MMMVDIIIYSNYVESRTERRWSMRALADAQKGSEEENNKKVDEKLFFLSRFRSFLAFYTAVLCS